MTTTYTAAVDEMFGMFKDVWEAESAAICGYVPEIRWQGVEEPEKPATDLFFARVSQQTAGEDQTTIRDGANGQRYTNRGLLFIQILAPRSESDSMEKLRQLSQMVKNTFKGHTSSSDIWFRRGQIREMPTDNYFYNFNVVTEYRYDEII